MKFLTVRSNAGLIIAGLTLLLVSIRASAQTHKQSAQSQNKAADTKAAPADNTLKPFRFVEQMPEFQGSLPQWLSANIRYPDSARIHNAEGRSVVEFAVISTGKIVNEKVVRTSGNNYLDTEALRVVRAMPAWKPGRQSGKAVDVIYTIPITFRLEN